MGCKSCFLTYADFHGPFKSDDHKDNLVKSWSAHEKDWKQGDPTWGNGKGKGIIGAINYPAAEGIGQKQNHSPCIHFHCHGSVGHGASSTERT